MQPAPWTSPAWPWGGARHSALNLTDHVCGLGQLRPLLRRSRGFYGHRLHHRSDERGGGDRKLERPSVRAACGTLPKVVVTVHLAGSSCDMAAIGALAERYGFALLEAASHAIGGRYQGEPVDNCRHSAIEVFSFHPVDIITTGEGGLATTNDPLLAQLMAELRSHGIVREAERFERPAAEPWMDEQRQLGLNPGSPIFRWRWA